MTINQYFTSPQQLMYIKKTNWSFYNRTLPKSNLKSGWIRLWVGIAHEANVKGLLKVKLENLVGNLNQRIKQRIFNLEKTGQKKNLKNTSKLSQPPQQYDEIVNQKNEFSHLSVTRHNLVFSKGSFGRIYRFLCGT